MKNQLVLAAILLVGGALSACANGGGDVTPNNPLNPSPLPTSAPQGNGPTTSPATSRNSTPGINGNAGVTSSPIVGSPVPSCWWPLTKASQQFRPELPPRLYQHW